MGERGQELEFYLKKHLISRMLHHLGEATVERPALNCFDQSETCISERSDWRRGRWGAPASPPSQGGGRVEEGPVDAAPAGAKNGELQSPLARKAPRAHRYRASPHLQGQSAVKIVTVLKVRQRATSVVLTLRF